MQVQSNEQSLIKSCEDTERSSVKPAAAGSISPSIELQNLSPDSSSLSPISTDLSAENDNIVDVNIPPSSTIHASPLLETFQNPSNHSFESLYQAAATASSALALWQNEYYRLARQLSMSASPTLHPTIPTNNPQAPLSPPLYYLLQEDSLYSLPARQNPSYHRYDGLPLSRKQLELEAKKAKMSTAELDRYEYRRIEALRVWPGVQGPAEKNKSRKRSVEEVDVVVEGPRVRRKTCKVEEATNLAPAPSPIAEAPAPKPKPKRAVKPPPAPITITTPNPTTPTTVSARGRPVNKTRSEAMAAAWAKRKAEGTNGRRGGAPIGKAMGKKGGEE